MEPDRDKVQSPSCFLHLFLPSILPSSSLSAAIPTLTHQSYLIQESERSQQEEEGGGEGDSLIVPWE